ncbi:MAG TPA: 50S ribosomal protein L6, partial [Pelobium sp.]|nr:50S ribosomal protein L6 [Pelobium sp.]
LTQQVDSDIIVDQEDGNIIVKRPTEQKRHKALHGLYRALINNMVVGVTEGFKLQQELVGVGYRASNQGNTLDLVLGYSHHIVFALPPEIKVATTSEKGKNPTIILESIDKQLLGQVAAKIRSLRAPEPYKGKGVKFVGEQLRRKAGKSASKK